MIVCTTFIIGVNSRLELPLLWPISTQKIRQNVNQSVATSSKKTIATDSTVKKFRNTTRKLYEQVSKTCSWWYPKYTPSGYKWKPKSQKGNVNSKRFSSRNSIHRADSGAQTHVPENLKLLNNNFVEKFLGTVKFGNDQIAPILGYGDLVQGAITIKRVYYVEGLNHNLFSVGQFCDADLEVAFWKSTCYIRDLKGNDLLTGSRGTDLYSITLQDSTSPNPICLMAKATSSQAWLWHRRLSHLNFDTINLLLKNNIVNGLPKLKFVKDHLCSSCELGKAKRKSFHTKTTPSSKRRLQLLHMDLCGPMRVESINGKKYVLVIVDDYSRYTWTHFLRSKDETPGVLIDFLTLVQRGLHAQVTTVRTDKGTEFLNKSLHAYLAQKKGKDTKTSAALTLNKTTLSKDRTVLLLRLSRKQMLSAAKVPLFFWAEAIATACFTQNRSLVIPRHEKTPYHIINARKPSVKFFHIFGSLCYIVRDGENLDKMKEKGDACIFVGYSTQSKAYRVFNKRTRMIVETIHVNFDELPQMASDHVSSDPETNTENAQFDDDEFINIFSTPVQEQGETSSRHVDTSNMHTFYQHHPSAQRWTKDHPLEQVIGNPSQSVRTRRQLETDGEMCMFATSHRAQSYQAKPTEKHLIAVKRIFRYLKDSINMGLWYPKDTGFELTAFSDSDHAGCLDSRKSTSGGIQFLGGDNSPAGHSKKQDYGFHFDKIPMYCDSKAAIAISCNPVQHSRTKHIDVRYHFIKEHVEKGIVELFFVGTEYQLADLFTKALSEDRFKYLVRRLGMRWNVDSKMNWEFLQMNLLDPSNINLYKTTVVAAIIPSEVNSINHMLILKLSKSIVQIKIVDGLIFPTIQRASSQIKESSIGRLLVTYNHICQTRNVTSMSMLVQRAQVDQGKSNQDDQFKEMGMQDNDLKNSNQKIKAQDQDRQSMNEQKPLQKTRPKQGKAKRTKSYLQRCWRDDSYDKRHYQSDSGDKEFSAYWRPRVMMQLRLSITRLPNDPIPLDGGTDPAERVHAGEVFFPGVSVMVFSSESVIMGDFAKKSARICPFTADRGLYNTHVLPKIDAYLAMRPDFSALRDLPDRLIVIDTHIVCVPESNTNLRDGLRVRGEATVVEVRSS
ncbi:retrovirus-related pol polyprotein from transposon TNT 1-94 [Tanacetum coccineum]|uniref:Retrovirus-related pol polyprotein from transposon TNT 1-94 n=1 Tax=Tanacetum coccineum TaxID=301880 RepID=A0ABQ5F2M0_9ASTR